MDRYVGLYGGVVADNGDPMQLGRVKVRVPILHGFEGNPSGLVAVKDLPWALPAGLPAGLSNDSGGIEWLPNVDDQVWVMFLDGELEKPVWMWGNQNTEKLKNFQLNKYSGSKASKEATLTKYQHYIKFTPEGIHVWTKSGWGFEIIDGKGISWTTPSGNRMEMTDLDMTTMLNGKSQTYAEHGIDLASGKGVTVAAPGGLTSTQGITAGGAITSGGGAGGGGGVTGSFSTPTGQIVTIVNGVVTNIY